MLADARSATTRRAFEGEVVGLIEKGAFIEFGEERFEGFLPVRRLRGWWTLNEVGTALEAEGSGRRLRLGDSIAGRGRPDRRAARTRGSRARRVILGLGMAKKGKRKAAPGDIATNRQASFRFNLLEKFEAGIVLQGSEVKSLREGGVQLKDAYADVQDGEVWLRNMHIAPYKPARENHDPERPRKLLLHRREIERLIGATSEKGLTIVPTRLYWNGPRAKVELAVAKGKDLYDKRRSIKERDTKREIERAMSERY